MVALLSHAHAQSGVGNEGRGAAQDPFAGVHGRLGPAAQRHELRGDWLHCPHWCVLLVSSSSSSSGGVFSTGML